jgi:HEAT repeat protein
MRGPAATIVLIICSLFPAMPETAKSTPQLQAQLEAVLDDWQSRASAREAALKIANDRQIPQALGAIAEGTEQPPGRRRHAIQLLATFKNGTSIAVLTRLTDHAAPPSRCLAIHSLAEIGSKQTIPILVGKLDDHSVCMKIQSTDPARTTDVYVSDEAVRALELVTGQTLGQQVDSQHRSAEPWKAWWSKQQKDN